jgi:uncharacterized protein (DUF433 family)
MKIIDFITKDKSIQFGQTVFKDTRVTVETLFDYIEAGKSIDEFLDEFPSVTKTQAIAVLDWSNKVFSSLKFEDTYEAVA